MQRRDFLAAAVAGGWLASTTVRAQDAPPAAEMTLGFSTYGMKTLKTERALEAIAKTGFDTAELTISQGWDADSAHFGAERRQAVCKQLAGLGLRISSLMENLHIDADANARRQRLERLKLAAGLAHTLAPDNPPLMQTVIGGGGAWREKKALYAEELAQWLKVADAEELTIAIKPHRGGALSRPTEAVELINQLGKPRRLRMCYDYSHYDLRDMPLESTVRAAMPWVGHIAVKDVVPDGKKTRFVLPGESGRIDYPKLLRLFYELGYRGDVCCEISGQVWSRKDYAPLSAAKTCYANMAEAFKKSGVPRPAKTPKR